MIDPGAVWDDEACPERQTGLTHVRDEDGHCPHCRAHVRRRPPLELAPAVAHRPEPPAFAPVPRYLRGEYMSARQRGRSGVALPDREAQALVAYTHGLYPTPGLPWTLQELARLEAVAAWVAGGRMGS